MGPQNDSDRLTREANGPAWLICACVLVSSIILSGCGSLEKPNASPYFAEVVPPAKQEFRLSNGRLPKSFDPALSAVPPETDVIRAIYECLTVADPKTLDAVPGVAEKWTADDNYRIWTFQLRRDAKWINGKSVTARDFVLAWNRLARLGETSGHPELLQNFARLKTAKLDPDKTAAGAKPPPPSNTEPDRGSKNDRNTAIYSSRSEAPAAEPSSPTNNASTVEKLKINDRPLLAVTAESDSVLSVTLETGDPDFPKLITNPVFSPIYGDGNEFLPGASEAAVVTNGPFRISAVSAGGVVLVRSDTFRNNGSVGLDVVTLVPAENTEEALESYRTGKVDAVTNAEFEPLAIKLLSPYEDFRRATHGALNLYEINQSKPPFSDRRVREALAIAIERERLTEGELEGVTRPALRFLPFGGKPVTEIAQDANRARKLLSAAGFPEGQGFPTIRLVINRNDTQQRVARAVARMWKQNLNIDTEITIKETAEMTSVRKSGEYDVIRRGIVFSTSDVQANLAAIFNPDPRDDHAKDNIDAREHSEKHLPASDSNRTGEERPTANAHDNSEALQSTHSLAVPTEAQALYDFSAIPLYFPTSFSLVKPYVLGFEPNSLDILLLKDIRIDPAWQPKRPNGQS